jgi:hypothetical protein
MLVEDCAKLAENQIDGPAFVPDLRLDGLDLGGEEPLRDGTRENRDEADTGTGSAN